MMLKMTEDACTRLEREAAALTRIETALLELSGAVVECEQRDHPNSLLVPEVVAIETLLKLVRERISEQARAHAGMIGWQVATYEIAELAKKAGEPEPIIWLTGNAMFPALRNLDALERVYQADREGDLWEVAVDALERRLDELHVYMGMPDYDNALYVVDLERWEHIDEEDMPEEGADDLADEWKRRS